MNECPPKHLRFIDKNGQVACRGCELIGMKLNNEYYCCGYTQNAGEKGNEYENEKANRPGTRTGGGVLDLKCE